MGPGRYADPQDLARNKKRKCTDADAQVVHVRDTGLVKPDARSAVAVTLAKCEEMAALDRRPNGRTPNTQTTPSRLKRFENREHGPRRAIGMCPLALETSMLVVIAAGVGAGSGGSRAPSAVPFRRDLGR